LTKPLPRAIVVNNQRYDWLTENIPVYTLGVVKVSTGVLKLVKLSAGDASTHKSKYKR